MRAKWTKVTPNFNSLQDRTRDKSFVPLNILGFCGTENVCTTKYDNICLPRDKDIFPLWTCVLENKEFQCNLGLM